ncbi:MAG: class I SAM-dependent methyltransferase [Myxococcaceae bacterium]
MSTSPDTHSVAAHLHVDVATYDEEIRRFVPHYDTAQAEVVDALTPRAPPSVLDVGCGTGALAARVFQAVPTARFTLLDADASMLEQARTRFHRLSRPGVRADFESIHGNFDSPLPKVDAIVSSLALHHVPSPEGRVATYRHLLGALEPGGVLINLDAMFDVRHQPTWDAWADHLVRCGDTRAQAFARFESWRAEDTYYPLDRELDFLREAGARSVHVRWRRGILAVVVARAGL